jgi:hypothetical protein
VSTARLAAVAAKVAVDVLAAPEFSTLRKLRRLFARGGLPPHDSRSPEDDARIACFVVISDLLRVLEDFRQSIARGERVRLVVREQRTAAGWMRAEVAIEARGAS